MSERDPSYNPCILLSNASDADADTLEEKLALHDFHSIIHELDKERKKLDSLISFESTARRQEVPEQIKDFTRCQIKASEEKVSQLSKQAYITASSDSLSNLVRKMYRKDFNDQVRRTRIELDKQLEKEREEVILNWKRGREAAERNYIKQFSAVSAAPKSPNPSIIDNNTKPRVGSRLRMLLWIIFFLAIVFFIIFVGKPTITVKNSGSPSIAPTESETIPEKPASLPCPPNGAIQIRAYDNSQYDSKITIHASSKNCVVKLKEADGKTALVFFVRAGENVTLPVPPKNLYAYFAEGDEWYGWKDYFGEDTLYSKDTNSLYFSNYTYEYTLYDVSDGNLQLTEIDASSF